MHCFAYKCRTCSAEHVVEILVLYELWYSNSAIWSMRDPIVGLVDVLAYMVARNEEVISFRVRLY